jgi:two-component system sensor histidine kinase KdpD
VKGIRRTRPRTPSDGIPIARRISGVVAGGVALPALSVVLIPARPRLTVVVLAYLCVVLLVSFVGGVWPAVVAAVASASLVNWFFVPPLHTWTVGSGQDIATLALFVAIALAVSSVVHLAGRRAALARRLSGDTQRLLDLARTILAGADDAGAILGHLAESTGHRAQLLEDVAGRWVVVAGRKTLAGQRCFAVQVRRDLRLDVVRPTGVTPVSKALIEGYANQAAAALDRARLRAQATQAEALAEADRMRAALLAAVSHDLRTPLASVKAAASSLRQTDITLSAPDRAELLATVEEGADRLNSLISNLLDMSRIQTGTLRPLLRALAVEEVAPLAMWGLDAGAKARFEIPEQLPLVRADPVLLERAIANLLANALRYSPPGRPPIVAARASGKATVIEIIDFGPGVPEDQRARIVEPFQQLDNRRRGAGVGLGLAVAKGFVEAMGGRLLASTTLGGGLTMSIELPGDAVATTEETAPPAPSPAL